MADAGIHLILKGSHSKKQSKMDSQPENRLSMFESRPMVFPCFLQPKDTVDWLQRWPKLTLTLSLFGGYELERRSDLL